MVLRDVMWVIELLWKLCPDHVKAGKHNIGSQEEATWNVGFYKKNMWHLGEVLLGREICIRITICVKALVVFGNIKLVQWAQVSVCIYSFDKLLIRFYNFIWLL